MSYVDIPLSRLAIAFLFLVAAALVSIRLRLDLVRTIVVGGLRGAVQLLAVGYGLVFVFGTNHPGPTCVALSVMLLAAAFTSAARVKHGPTRKELLAPALLAIFVGSALSIVPGVLFIFRAPHLLEPRTLIPISGMVVSQAMNVVALTLERMFSGAAACAAEIEQRLSLGARVEDAMAETTRDAVRAAMIPTLNGLSTVGLVALPGMMTGQILSGTDPLQAIRYQLAILLALVCTAAVSGALAAWLARARLFTLREQLVLRHRENQFAGK